MVGAPSERRRRCRPRRRTDRPPRTCSPPQPCEKARASRRRPAENVFTAPSAASSAAYGRGDLGYISAPVSAISRRSLAASRLVRPDVARERAASSAAEYSRPTYKGRRPARRPSVSSSSSPRSHSRMLPSTAPPPPPLPENGPPPPPPPPCSICLDAAPPPPRLPPRLPPADRPRSGRASGSGRQIRRRRRAESGAARVRGQRGQPAHSSLTVHPLESLAARSRGRKTTHRRGPLCVGAPHRVAGVAQQHERACSRASSSTAALLVPPASPQRGRTRAAARAPLDCARQLRPRRSHPSH